MTFIDTETLLRPFQVDRARPPEDHHFILARPAELYADQAMWNLYKHTILDVEQLSGPNA
jgi:hypothetical protein